MFSYRLNNAQLTVENLWFSSLLQNYFLKSRNAFVTTKSELKLMAAAPMDGVNKIPAQAKTPAATGIPITLYMNAQKRFSFIILSDVFA